MNKFDKGLLLITFVLVLIIVAIAVAIELIADVRLLSCLFILR